MTVGELNKFELPKHRLLVYFEIHKARFEIWMLHSVKFTLKNFNAKGCFTSSLHHYAAIILHDIVHMALLRNVCLLNLNKQCLVNMLCLQFESTHKLLADEFCRPSAN